MKKSCLDCRRWTYSGSRCDTCAGKMEARRQARRASRQDRGYDAEYDRNRGLLIWRVKVAQRRGQIVPCFRCGEPVGDDVTADHIVPWRDGGANSLANLAPAHSACNSGARGNPR